MNTNQYIQHESKWLLKAEQLMLQELPITELTSVELAKFKELVNRVLQAEFEFLNEAPEEYQELYGGNELRIIK